MKFDKASVEVHKAITGFNNETLAPTLNVLLTITVPVEPLRDGVTTGEVYEMYTELGEMISNAVTEYNKSKSKV